MIKIKNIENGEVIKVWQTGIEKASGRIYCNGTPTAKYLAKYPLTATDDKIGEDTVLTLNDGWEVVKGRTPKPSSPKPIIFLIKANGFLIDTAFSKQELREKASVYEKTLQGKRYKKEYCKYDEVDGVHFGYDFTLFDETGNIPQATSTTDTTAIEDTTFAEAQVVDTENTDNNTEAEVPVEKPKKDEPKVEPQPTKDEQPEAVEVVTEDDTQPETMEQTADDTTNEQALIAALKNLRGGAVDIAKVREIVAEELSKLVASDAKKAAKVIEAAKKNKGKKNEVYCAKFQRIVAKVSRGNNVYLYGPAGSGKSHTAEQVADALGLDFYGQTTIQFAHDVRGYGDAGGNFQETPFFKAFCYGGLYFQDEYDRSNAEAAIVLNSALANGWYDFPIVGRVEAHPNFRFMAAGNTLMTGADEEYVTGQEIDASSRDRFAYFFEVDYSHEVELRIAHGNESIVSFVEDVRQAIKDTGIKHVVSYRATAAMIDEVDNENDLTACCDESIFKALDVDARREIYERLNDRTNVWAKALKKLL